MLRDLSVSEEAIAAERRSMEEIAIARTIHRHVVGSLNDFSRAVRFAREDRLDESPHDLSLWLAQTLPLKDVPMRMARRLLEAPAVTHRGPSTSGQCANGVY